MNVSDWAAVVQAVCAGIIILLTVVLAKTASGALATAKDQSRSAADTITEMRKDRHLDAVPVLSIKPGRFSSPGEQKKESMAGLSWAAAYPYLLLSIKNEGTTAALNVRIWLGEASEIGKPEEIRLATPPGLAMVSPGFAQVLPIDVSKFTVAPNGQRLRTDWVHVCVTYDGLLGARVAQDWYWEPDEWAGEVEPLPGHGEKLVLYSMKGTSGTEPGVQDVNWNRG